MISDYYKKKYRKILIRLNKQKILEQYQMVLRVSASEKRLELLTIEDENNTHLPVLDEKSCLEHYTIKTPFEDKDKVKSFLHKYAKFPSESYFLWVDTSIPSYYLMDSLSDLDFSFDFGFSTGIMSLRSINLHEYFLIEWEMESDKPIFEVNYYSNVSLVSR